MTSVKKIKETAKNILNKDLFTHICAFLFPIICLICIISSGITLAGFANGIIFSVMVYLLYYFVVIMSVPLIYGYSVFLCNCAKYKKADFFDIFTPFNSIEAFSRSFKVFFALLWRFLVVFSLPIILINKFILYVTFSEKSLFVFYGYDLTYTAFVIFITAFSILSAIIYSKYSLALYLCVTREDKKVSECFFAAKIYLKGCSKKMLYLAISFIPFFILSIATAGILFVYFIPAFLLSLFCLVHDRYNNNKLDSKIIKQIFN